MISQNSTLAKQRNWFITTGESPHLFLIDFEKAYIKGRINENIKHRNFEMR